MMVLLLTAAPAAAQPIEPLGPQLRLTQVGADGDDAVDSAHADVAYNSVRDEYLVVWTKSDGFTEIWARRLHSDGSPAGEPFLVRGAHAGYPAVAYDPERDRYGVAFTQFSGGGSEVLVQRISGDGGLIRPNGAPGAAPTTASLTPGTDAMFPEIVYRPDANGDSSPGDRWIVAYRTSHPTSEVYLSAVGTVTSDVLVDRQVSAMPGAGEAEYPSLAVVPGSDDLLVAWEGYPSDSDSAEIWVNRVAGHLPALDTGQVPITTTGGSARRPSIAVDPDTNRFLIAYSATETATEGTEIHVQRIDAGLGQVGVDDQQVSSAGPADSGGRFWVIAPAAAYHRGLRRYLVTWVGTDDGRPGYADSELEVTGTVLDADGVESAPQDFAISRMGAPGSELVDFVQPMTSAIAADPGSKRWLVLWNSDDPQPPLADEEYETYGGFVGELPAANAAPAPTGTTAAPALTKARLVRRFRVRATHTRVRRLAIAGAEPGMRIELRCHGRGCPLALRRINVKRTGVVNLKPVLRRARLRPGAVLSVRIVEPGALDRVVRLRIRDGRRPLAL